MATAAVMMNAANLAYHKVVSQTRDRNHLLKTHPLWMSHFADNLTKSHNMNMKTKKDLMTPFQRKEYLSESEDFYERLGWKVFRHVVSKAWFETFVMLNIVLIGVATGIDLENAGRSPSITSFVEVTTIVTKVVFTVECILKLITEGYRPQNYFLDQDNGKFNTFDFVIVVLGYVFVGSTNGGAVGALRMMRLIRLLTFIKGVPQLRVIISGVIQGINSVTYIVVLLFLVIYMFAIMGCLLFGANDPARFGSVAIATVSLFQVSTLSSWGTIAYTSWYGCGNYQGDQYAISADPKSIIRTSLGQFEGYKCDVQKNSQATAFFFFSFYIVLTAWVIMSLFIGVISMGMFEAFQTMKTANNLKKYRSGLSENMDSAALDAEGGHAKKGDGSGSGEGQPQIFSVGDENDRNALNALAAKGTKKGKSLCEKIDYILEDYHHTPLPATFRERVFVAVTSKCLEIRGRPWFNSVVTATILVAGLVIGLDTDKLLFCKRLKRRQSDRDDDDDSPSRWDSYCADNLASNLIRLLSQIIFTAECAVKILAEGWYPMQYFLDKKDGRWNCLDFFVVFMGYVEMSPASAVTKAFPVVILRLLRLLRVFRLAKALPRLRSIVEALLSGLEAVGWICVLIVAFNYITGCMCMLFLKENDPFHFGSVGRAMFTILRIETLDTWDQPLYVAMFGCEAYPAAYPLLDQDANPNTQCKHSKGLGWGAAFLFFVIIIIGSYILPTVLVGIISISFDEASRKAQALADMEQGVDQIVAQSEASLPGFFTHGRLQAIRDVFDHIDVDGEYSLDMNEVAPFYHYCFQRLFGVSLTREQTEALFYLMDSDGDTALGFSEFVTFVVVTKQIEMKCKRNQAFRKSAFPNSVFGLSKSAQQLRRKQSWAHAVKQMDNEALNEAWTTIFNFLGNLDDGFDPTQVGKLREMFEAYDTDKSGSLNASEVSAGLVSCGVLINDRQSSVLIQSLDEDGDGDVKFDEFMTKLMEVRKKRKQAQAEKNEAEAMRILESVEPEIAKRVSERRKSFRGSGTGFAGVVGLIMNEEEGADDNDRSLEDVVAMCVERIAKRMVWELAKRSLAVEKKQETTTSPDAGREPGSDATSSPPLDDRKLKQEDTGDDNIVVSTKHLELAITLKKVLNDRVLHEFSNFHDLCTSGGSGKEKDTSGEGRAASKGGVENGTPGKGVSAALFGELMSRTLDIAQDAPGIQPTASPRDSQLQVQQEQQQVIQDLYASTRSLSRRASFNSDGDTPRASSLPRLKPPKSPPASSADPPKPRAPPPVLKAPPAAHTFNALPVVASSRPPPLVEVPTAMNKKTKPAISKVQPDAPIAIVAGGAPSPGKATAKTKVSKWTTLEHTSSDPSFSRDKSNASSSNKRQSPLTAAAASRLGEHKVSSPRSQSLPRQLEVGSAPARRGSGGGFRPRILSCHHGLDIPPEVAKKGPAPPGVVATKKPPFELPRRASAKANSSYASALENAELT